MTDSTQNGGDAASRSRRSRATTGMEQEQWFTVGEGAVYLGITEKSLRKYLQELKLRPIPHRGDQRRKYYSQTQLNTLADAKGLVPGQKPPTMKSLALDLRNLRHEVEELRQALETIRQQMEADHAQLALPPLPPSSPPRPQGTIYRDFVARHTTERDVELLMEQGRKVMGWQQRARPGWVETVSREGQQRLVNSWRGQPGIHQCLVHNCPCHRVLPE